MAIIFYLSSQVSTDSSNTTNIVINIMYSIYKALFRNNAISLEVFANYAFAPTRKLAHLTEYAILGMLFYININNNKIKYSLILSILFSISDEIHQYFVPGRFCSATDVLIDTCGIVLGIFLIHQISIKCKKE